MWLWSSVANGNSFIFEKQRWSTSFDVYLLSLLVRLIANADAFLHVIEYFLFTRILHKSEEVRQPYLSLVNATYKYEEVIALKQIIIAQAVFLLLQN